MNAPAADRRVRGSGSQRALRAANRSRLVRALRDRGPSTQADLSRGTGLSAATVSNLVRLLLSEGVVETETTTSSGRRAVLVSLSRRAGDRFAVGIDIGRRHLRVLACTPARQILGERVRPLPVGHLAEDTIACASTMLDELLVEADLGRADIIGCGVGIPGPIDERTGQIAHGVILPEWVGLPLEDHLTTQLGLPVHVENDANLGAIAEIWWGEHGVSDLEERSGGENLVFVKIGSGIGAGLVMGGRLHRGHIGITGELGHVGVTEYGPVCRCGSRGCLETVASVSTMLDLMRPGDAGPEPTIDDLIRLAHAGDPATLRIVEDAGLAIGRVLGGVANLLGPRMIVLGGPVIPLGDLLVDSVKRGLARWSSPVVAGATDIVMSSLDGRAEALGACAQVLHEASDESWTPRRATRVPVAHR